eukprot:TRINITY_DN7894_c0_g1_i2.p1 TRINITY_DN7894_c0_g1~~TRINITY_DN7894_c0_g1_i2.p1  ORF type:complete len:154 (-),score=24.50 TRINITY_DN7894_c0_g1_i2:92-553(-)
MHRFNSFVGQAFVNSKPTKILTYKQACARCTAEEIERLKMIFKTFATKATDEYETGKGKLGIEKSTFVSETLDAGLPDKIVERFFVLFTKETGSKFLPWKQFVRGMVLFCKGTPKEKGRRMYAHLKRNYITKKNLNKSFFAEYKFDIKFWVDA